MADAKLVGEEPRDWVGASVSGAGDVDGDGHDDLLVGAPHQVGGGLRGGAAYLVLGPVTGSRDLGLADAKLLGEESSDYAGVSVSGAGDVDGDGHDDLLVGARYVEDSPLLTLRVQPTWCRVPSWGPWTCPWPMPRSSARRAMTGPAKASRARATWMATGTTTC